MSLFDDPELARLATDDAAPRPTTRAPLPMGLVVVGWLGAVLFGMGSLFAYSFTPGTAAAAPERWPTATRLERALDTPTLVMVVHPQCSCSRASIGELSWLMTRLAGRVRGHVLFVRPEGLSEGWEQTDLWRSAEIISGVEVSEDPGGVEAARFGAFTSGQVYLYGADGDLRFAGGITPSRSHAGQSVGRQRIVSLVTSDTADRDRSDVYGCALNDSESASFNLPSLRGMSTSP